jgi:F-type H+-transporting ATPase subunit a
MIQPLQQFIVKPILNLYLFGMNLSLTNSALFMVLSVVCLALFFFCTLRQRTLIPSMVQSSAEFPLVMISNMIEETNGPAGQPFLSFIASIFLFVLMGNVLGLFPFAFTFTSQIIINFSLALFIVSVITVVGFVKHGLKFLRLFCPPGVPLFVAPILIPIELISYIARPLSLAIRLFANMVAGHSMLKIFAYFTVSLGVFGILPLAVNMGLIAFELLIAFLQAYVFAMLSCIYLNDALELH